MISCGFWCHATNVHWSWFRFVFISIILLGDISLNFIPLYLLQSEHGMQNANLRALFSALYFYLDQKSKYLKKSIIGTCILCHHPFQQIQKKLPCFFPLIVLYRGRQQKRPLPCRTKAAITAHNVVVRLLSLEVTEAAAARLSTHSEFVMKYFSKKKKKKAHGFLLWCRENGFFEPC